MANRIRLRRIDQGNGFASVGPRQWLKSCPHILMGVFPNQNNAVEKLLTTDEHGFGREFSTINRLATQ